MSAKRWVIVVILSISMILFIIGGTLHKYTLGGVEKVEIDNLLTGAIEDTSWMRADTIEELEVILGRYYTNPLLDELISNTWVFIREPTDWYGQAKLENFELIRYDRDEIIIHAQISETDLNFDDTIWGAAIYTVKKTNIGWKVSNAEYYWNMKD